MATYRFQFTMLTADGLPENYVTNTLYTASVDDADAGDCLVYFLTFMRSIGASYSTYIQQNNHQYDVYRMSDATPRTPILSGLWNLTSAPTNPPLPPEVALCLSFQGDPFSGDPQSRRRGRIYVGPLRANESDSSGRPISALINRLADAGANLLDDIAANTDSAWSVYSPTAGGTVIITNGWVDNEYDTQRRRGRKATARTLWS
uniref:Uncharacterized protein n=1 Tax=uncultured prokaryote TaxID=198431 RepID=A0A0H5Q793_9ZZZZ|nr:hypothetical protein [uncultured prokaryote]